MEAKKIYKEYYSDRKLREQTTFGTKGCKEWNSDGNDSVGFNDAAADLNGEYTYWYKTGMKYLECNYKNGQLEGRYTRWSTDGEKDLECNLRDGIEEGRHKEYDNNRLTRDDYYILGRRVLDILRNRMDWMRMLGGITILQLKIKTILRIKRATDIREGVILRLIYGYI